MKKSYNIAVILLCIMLITGMLQAQWYNGIVGLSETSPGEYVLDGEDFSNAYKGAPGINGTQVSPSGKDGGNGSRISISLIGNLTITKYIDLSGGKGGSGYNQLDDTSLNGGNGGIGGNGGSLAIFADSVQFSTSFDQFFLNFAGGEGGSGGNGSNSLFISLTNPQISPAIGGDGGNGGLGGHGGYFKIQAPEVLGLSNAIFIGSGGKGGIGGGGGGDFDAKECNNSGISITPEAVTGKGGGGGCGGDTGVAVIIRCLDLLPGCTGLAVDPCLFYDYITCPGDGGDGFGSGFGSQATGLRPYAIPINNLIRAYGGDNGGIGRNSYGAIYECNSNDLPSVGVLGVGFEYTGNCVTESSIQINGGGGSTDSICENRSQKAFFEFTTEGFQYANQISGGVDCQNNSFPQIGDGGGPDDDQVSYGDQNPGAIGDTTLYSDCLPTLVDNIGYSYISEIAPGKEISIIFDVQNNKESSLSILTVDGCKICFVANATNGYHVEYDKINYKNNFDELLFVQVNVPNNAVWTLDINIANPTSLPGDSKLDPIIGHEDIVYGDSDTGAEDVTVATGKDGAFVSCRNTALPNARTTWFYVEVPANQTMNAYLSDYTEKGDMTNALEVLDACSYQQILCNFNTVGDNTFVNFSNTTSEAKSLIIVVQHQKPNEYGFEWLFSYDLVPYVWCTPTIENGDMVFYENGVAYLNSYSNPTYTISDYTSCDTYAGNYLGYGACVLVQPGDNLTLDVYFSGRDIVHMEFLDENGSISCTGGEAISILTMSWSNSGTTPKSIYTMFNIDSNTSEWSATYTID